MKEGTDILITGGTGFLGYFLAKRILEKDEKALVTLLSMGEPDELVRDLQARYERRLKFDMRDVREMDETWYPHIDQVYHLAAKKVTTASDLELSALDTNTKIDDAVFYSLTDLGQAVKMLYVSTGEVFGPLWERMAVDGFSWPVPERNGLAAVNVYESQWMYALSKIVGEMRIMHENHGYRWSIARLQNPYGPRMGDKTLIPTLMRSAITGELAKVYGNDTRPFLYAEDVADAFITIMNSSHTDGKIINVAGPEMELGDLVPLVQKIAGTFPVEVINRPAHISNHVRALDTSELQALGWHPWIDINEGLLKTWEYYKDKIKA